MLRHKALIAAVGATLAVAALAVAPAADAHGNVGLSFSIAGPGYAVGVGNAPYYAPTYVAPTYVAPPAYPYYAPPAYSYYAPPVYSAPVVVAAAPYRYYHRPYYGRVYYHHH